MHRYTYIAFLASSLMCAAIPALAAAPAAAAPAAAAPASTAAAAVNCPAHGMDNVTRAISGAANCRAAVGMLKACAFGSSADNALAGAAIAKCESRFSRRITKQRFRAYRDAQRRCEAKYAKMEGSMYQSMAAICRADAALAYSRATRRLR